MKLGEILRTYRKEHGLSMQDIADATGLSRGYISIIESG